VNRNGVNIEYSVETAGIDILDLLIYVDAANATAPQSFSTWALPNCSSVSASAYSGVTPVCPSQDPTAVPSWIIDWHYGYMGYSTGREVVTNLQGASSSGVNYVAVNTPFDPSTTDVFMPAVVNLAQVVAAAIKIDLGIIEPNNLILNSTVRPQTLASTFAYPGGTMDSLLYSNQYLAWTGEPPQAGATINAEYLCRFSYPQNPGTALINVLVATFSLFNTGWGLALAVFAYMYARRPEDHHCDGCIAVRAERNSTIQSPQTPYMEKLDKDPGGGYNPQV